MRAVSGLCLYPISDLPEIEPGCSLAKLLYHVLQKYPLEPGDILVVTHKIISKAEGLVFPQDQILPSPLAEKLAQSSKKTSQLAELILRCSSKIYVCARDIWIAVRHDGWVCCNAGVDQSNTGGKNRAVLLPENCDAYARVLSERLSEQIGFDLPVIICDTQGRILRNGAVGVSMGSFGFLPIRYYVGQEDRDGRILQSSEEAVVDELAGAATLLMGQGKEGIPAVLIQGFSWEPSALGSRVLQRSEDQQLYKITGEVYGSEHPTAALPFYSDETPPCG